MSNKVIFLNDDWFWAVLAGAVILLCVFIWKELSSGSKRRILLKLALSFFAITALALIALKPALRNTETAGKIVILTQGFERSQLDSLKRAYPRIKVSKYDRQKALPGEVFEANKIYILGYGIPDYELPQFKDIPLVFIKGPSPSGIVKIKFPNKISLGERFTISGLYNKPTSGNYLILEGPGGAGIDSLELKNEKEQSFKLSTELKAAGKFVYFLAEKDEDGKILSKHPIPVQVEEMVAMRILVLNNFPTFETKYLKNFLAEAGHEVVVRSQITSGRFKFEYFNTDRISIGNLSETILEPYDLLIIDAPSFRSLSGSQIDAIYSAVKEKGLGVFVQPDDIFLSSPEPGGGLTFERQNVSEIRLEQWPGVNLSVYPYELKTSQGTELIYTSEGNRGIAGYKRFGLGRVGSMVLSATWQLVISGESDVYKEFWSRMISRLAKRDDKNILFETGEQFAFPHEPLEFTLKSQIDKPVITKAGVGKIPLMQDINFHEQWKGTVWPREEGWHQFQQDTSIVFEFYVLPEGAWSNLMAYRTIKKNLQYFNFPGKEVSLQNSYDPINLLWFFGLFLICMGGLWLEPKLS